MEKFYSDALKAAHVMGNAGYCDVDKFKDSNYTQVSTNAKKRSFSHSAFPIEKDVKACMDSYIAIADFSLGELTNAYGGLDFIFANRKIKKCAYTKIYEKLRLMRNDASNNAYHFRLAIAGEGNMNTCLALIKKLNDSWFKIEKEIDDECEITKIYSSFHDELCNDIERFRAKIYGDEPNIFENRLIMGELIKLNAIIGE